MRIVGGRWAGKDLTSPGGRVRPTAEETRDRWITLLQDDIRGVRVLDLYAGTGAVGLEALSRGARSADFVENNPAALHSLKANVAALRVGSRTRIFKRDALRFAAALDPHAFGVALADPPYGSRQADRLVEHWLATPFAGVLSVEHASDHELPGRPETHVMGASSLSVYRAGDPAVRSGG